ncbi:MAG: alpha/beta fold hydrolase [Bacteroidales bacterium]|nr:alpha/beta fold hydrolase [Bacteroidales bacterium]
MKLFYREYGVGPPLIFIHGFLGMSDNWIPVGKSFSKTHKVYLLDIRNHGQSPHSEEHNYNAMRSDIKEFMSYHKITKATLIGHSMGGKLVMNFACIFPDLVESIIVIDISPRSYLNNKNISGKALNHKELLNFMKNFDIKNIKDRKEVFSASNKKFGDEFINQMIQKNIKRNSDKSFSWKLNLEVLIDNIEHIAGKIEISEKSDKIKSLFIFGKESLYFSEKDYNSVKDNFPDSDVKVIKKSGHNIHIDNKERLIEEIKQFLQ